jgi:hypothetical protein
MIALLLQKETLDLFYNCMPLTFGRKSSTCLLAADGRISTTSSVCSDAKGESKDSSDASKGDASAASSGDSSSEIRRLSDVSACTNSIHEITKALRLGFLRLFRGRKLNNSLVAVSFLLLLLLLGILQVMALAPFFVVMSEEDPAEYKL